MSEEKRLDMYGGILGGAVPLAVLIIGLVWLCLAERGGTQPFWACAWLALVIGLFFARKKEDYCLAAMRGIGDENGIVIITAWLFAGVFGQLMAAGYFLGADPAMLGLAILSGAAFGDNLSPIADTTIVSAYTQGATMKEVVRSRFPLSMSAAVMAMVIFLIFGNADQAAALPDIQKDFDPAGVLMLIALVVVVGSAMMGRHIIESLVYGNVCAAVIAVLTGHIKPTQIFGIPAQAGQSTGYIENGILSVVGPIIFAILILAVTQIMVECGIMKRILDFAHKSLVSTVRQAELFIVGVTVLASIPISANAPAELLVGPSIVRPMGERFNLSAARRANLMDCAVSTVFYILPWHIAVATWYGALYSAAQSYNIPAPALSTALYNPYSWTLLAVLLFSAITGWNRKLDTPAATNNA